MEKDYTREAQMAVESYVKTHPHFHGPITSMNEGTADFSLKEASDLIKTAAPERQHALRRIEAEQELAQQRENVSLLPDREAERIQAEWVEQSRQQAEAYSKSKNSGATPRSTQGVDPDVRLGVLSWIDRQRRRGHLKKN